MGEKMLLPLHLQFFTVVVIFFSLTPMEKSGWFSLLASVVWEATRHGWFFYLMLFSQAL
jgi:hypothetical protein